MSAPAAPGRGLRGRRCRTRPAGPGAEQTPIVLAAGVILVLTAGGFLVRRWWTHRQSPALFRDYD
ncbi:LPXTG cell wall anchor domain-containing protein [Methanoculleus sediminis]|uniref:LPXTG cell wall anchor domain-containing protein n=1 Tax=Methanoculleus sediminis TaxID=1550566 RepID=UPI000A7A2043|nr:LPXTG cell wall anchor domain-containing protein [Methanoculleus sediminis]